MEYNLYHAIEACPVIAAVKDEAGLRQVAELENRVVFVLTGDLLNIGDIIRRLREAGKLVIVHADLIQGLSGKEVAADFLKVQGAHGIITTKPTLIKRGRELDMSTILRFFVLDSMSLKNMEKSARECRPDLIEILPGVMPKVIARIRERQSIPLLCGGLIADKGDVMDALKAGAMAISTSNPDLWSI